MKAAFRILKCGIHIKSRQKLIGVGTVIILLFITEIAEAQYGAATAVRRTTRRRTAVVVSAATHEKDQQSAQAASQGTQASDSTKQTQPTAPTEAAQPAPQSTTTSGDRLPIGTVVSKLPEGCTATPVNDIQYYHCGNDYYRAAYQGNNLVYVTTEAPGG